jgi:hypothetical protein
MDYSDNALRAAIRALETVIGPVVAAAGDAQAEDQLGLVVDALRFIEVRWASLGERAAFGDRNAVRLAQDLAELVPPDAAEPLRRSATEAEATGAVRDLLRGWPSMAPLQRQAVARQVLASERRRVEADRSWFAPLGFDPVPGTIVGLEEAWS